MDNSILKSGRKCN